VYGLDACKSGGSIPGHDSFSFPPRPDRQGPTSVLSSGYQRPVRDAKRSHLLGSEGQERVELHLHLTAKANLDVAAVLDDFGVFRVGVVRVDRGWG
jgi:hypothetical protein